MILVECSTNKNGSMSRIIPMCGIVPKENEMKKIAGIALGAAFLCGISGATGTITVAKADDCVYTSTFVEEKVNCVSAQGLQTRAKSAYLMDFDTKTPIYAQKERERLPIASMCKIMTLLLSFEAIDNGALDLKEEVFVSERAASMGGSQVFLEANAKYPVSELIKSIVVCSANDSCVAMAEKIAGSEELFVERMNEKAKQLGATDTLFANCTGLPKDPQYSSAKDVALMLEALLNHKEYFDFGKVWMDKFMHSKGRYTEISNTNKLVRFYDGCDGGKTGFTNEAGFCLAATAKRGDMRIISVVIGEETSANRFEDVKTMFDYAFANYTRSTIVDASQSLSQTALVSGGKVEEVSVYPERSAYAFMRKGDKANITIDKRLNSVKAPVEKGEKVGELVIYQDGVEKERMDLLAGEEVKAATVMDRLKKIARKWNG